MITEDSEQIRDENSHSIWLFLPPKVHQRVPMFDVRLNDIKRSFPTSGKTHWIFIRETNRSIRIWTIIAVYCQDHRKRLSTLCKKKNRFRVLRHVVYIVTTAISESWGMNDYGQRGGRSKHSNWVWSWYLVRIIGEEAQLLSYERNLLAFNWRGMVQA
jgi:hypothetical protein